mgnify:CR=1 FL=1
MIDSTLLWDELKSHIAPSEVDYYARCIGLAKISRNEDAYNELQLLKQMQNSIQADLNDEIEKKNPMILYTPQRNKAINAAIHFLDSLREKGHLVEPSNDTDSQVMKYLKFAKFNRPNSGNPQLSKSSKNMNLRENRMSKSARSLNQNISESIEEIQALLDEEYQKIQTDTTDIRIQLFTSCEQLDEVKSIDPPSTDSIQSFAKKLKAKDVTLNNIANQTKSSCAMSRLRESIRLNRIWE